DHQQVVPAGRRHFERTAGDLLSTHLAQIRQTLRMDAAARLWPRAELVAAKMIDEREEALGRNDVDLLSGPGGLGPGGLGADDAEVAPVGRDRRGENAGRGREAAVEP